MIMMMFNTKNKRFHLFFVRNFLRLIKIRLCVADDLKKERKKEKKLRDKQKTLAIDFDRRKEKKNVFPQKRK